MKKLKLFLFSNCDPEQTKLKNKEKLPYLKIVFDVTRIIQYAKKPKINFQNILVLKL